MVKSGLAIEIEQGEYWKNIKKDIYPSTAIRMQMLLDLMEVTIKTGKRGRPKKLLKMKDLKKLLKDING